MLAALLEMLHIPDVLVLDVQSEVLWLLEFVLFELGCFFVHFLLSSLELVRALLSLTIIGVVLTQLDKTLMLLGEESLLLTAFTTASVLVTLLQLTSASSLLESPLIEQSIIGSTALTQNVLLSILSAAEVWSLQSPSL